MNARSIVLLCLVGCAGEAESNPVLPQAEAQGAPSQAARAQAESLYQLKARTMAGGEQSLGAYAGKVVLVVNTASECGYTPQYAELEQLYAKYKDRGLVVLGFPSNDFGGQEPGTDKEVLSFSQSKYGVSFPMFSKSVVKGERASPVYRFLAENHGEPAWNFHKYLVDRHGKVVAAFPSAVAPLDASLIEAVERALTSA